MLNPDLNIKIRDKFFNKLENKPYSLYNVENILEKIENITVNEQYESIKKQTIKDLSILKLTI